MFAEMKEVLKKAAEMEDKDAKAIYITSKCNDMQTQAFEDGKKLLKEVPSCITPATIYAEDIVSNRTEIEYTAILKDKHENRISNKTLIFEINGETYTNITNSNGVATVNLILPNGLYEFPVIFKGDEELGKRAAIGSIIINSTNAVDLAAPEIEMYYKNGTQFKVSLTANGTGIANESVIITINGVNNTHNTDENGTIAMNINLNSGEYPVVVYYKGNDKYDPAKVNSKVTVLSTVNSTDVTKVFRNGTQYYATFVDGQGKYLANGTTVTFNINGVEYKRQINGSEGKARLNINLPQGEYIITAINPVTSEMAANNITVLSKIAENKDLVKYYKNDSQYVVKIIGDDGKPVGENQTVTFNINGVMYERKTNASGHAKLNINLPPENYVITAMYGGCNVANNITVLPVLSAEDLTKKYGDLTPFIANLVDGQGLPLANATVKFNINGRMYERNTNGIGQAKLNINLIAGEYIITSSYNGANIANKITITT